MGLDSEIAAGTPAGLADRSATVKPRAPQKACSRHWFPVDKAMRPRNVSWHPHCNGEYPVGQWSDVGLAVTFVSERTGAIHLM